MSQEMDQTMAPQGDYDPRSDLGSGKDKRNRGSLLGASIGRSPTAGGSRPGTASVDPAITRKIAQRYQYEVKASEDARRSVFVPLDREDAGKPQYDANDIAKMMKQGLDGALKSAGAAAVGSQGWDALLGSDTWQKRIQFLNDHAKTGHFIEKYGTEGRYEGEFLYGMRHGKGNHEFRGEVFEGDWKWDKRHGHGKLTTPDNTVVNSEWIEGKQHGFATIVDPKGTITYEGEFAKGKRHGLGRQLFESGDMYDGGWSEGRLNDRGVYYFINGDKLYGMWKHGVYDGVGVFHYADGSISRRVYKDGLLMTVQEYEHSSQKFGKTLTREGMQKHTRDEGFPQDVFMLSQC